MSKIQAKHNVDKNVARFGVADSPEMCESVAQSIPAEVLKNAKRILDVGIGCGGIARAIVKRLVNELYVDWDDAILRVYGVDNNLALVNKAKRNGFINTTCEDFLQWQPEMQFDVIVGNPPYNNSGKIKGQKNTSGTSLWVQFLKRTVEFLNPGGYSSLLVPSAVGNSNSVGWRALKDVNVVEIETGLETYFNVGTAISRVSFVNECPTPDLVVNGVKINRNEVNILPIVSDPMAVSIMQKIQKAGEPMKWERSSFPKFLVAAKNNPLVLGMPALDRGPVMRPRTLEELMAAGNLTKCEILRVEVSNPDKFRNLVNHPLFRFFHSQTGATGNQTLGTLRFLTLPSGWEELETDREIFDAYGLTKEEVAYLVR